MTNTTNASPTEAEVRSAAERLQAFLAGLSDSEQTAMRSLFQRVIAEGSDANEVMGYMESVGGGTEYQVMVDGVLTWVFPTSTDTGPTWQPVNSPYYHNDDL